ncbi:hypothetical protein [Sinomonas atrocyanea]|uniref:hypothetical protein n=1 Tax=Sinomonas atrocyanea TaxID=37927 RepID=UPI003D978E3D
MPVLSAAQSRAPFRSLRTTAIAGTVTALAAGAHAWAGGSLPHPFIVLALVALVALASTVAGRYRLRVPALIAVLGAGQLALHEAFTAFAAPGSAPSAAAAVLALGRHQHPGDAGAALASVPGTAVSSDDVLTAHAHASPLMLALHAAATVACAVVLRRAELALTALARWLRPLTRLPRPTAVVPPATPGPVRPRAARRVLPWRQLAPPLLRGPPPAPAFA